MNTNDTAVLKAACEIFADEYISPATSIPLHLATADKNLLAQKILLLPEPDRSLVFFRYYFGLGPAATGEFLGIANPRTRMACCAELLAVTLGMDGAVIDDASMEAAARRAMSRYLFSNNQTVAAPPHRYSKGFHKRLHEISAIPHRGGMVLLFAKRIAIAALISAIIITTAFAAIPELRELVFGWVVNTFPKYSQIGAADVSREPTEADFEILKQYYPAYIPEGYELYQCDIKFPWISYKFRNNIGERVFFDGDLASGNLSGYDTEGVTVETLTFRNQPAFCWEKNDTIFFIWQQDGFQFSVVGKINKNEAIKMAKYTKFGK